MKIKLSKPTSVGGKDVEELDLDLDSLTGGDIDLCIREAIAATGQVVVAYEIDPEVQAQVAMKLTGVSREALRKMPARDYRKVMTSIRNFFLESD